MRTYRDLTAEMQQNGHIMTAPATGQNDPPARVIRAGGDARQEADDDTNIEPWMEAAFHGLTHASETGEAFALISSFMNGEPTAVIAITRRQGSRTHVLPLFVACTRSMTFEGHPENATGDEKAA